MLNKGATAGNDKWSNEHMCTVYGIVVHTPCTCCDFIHMKLSNLVTVTTLYIVLHIAMHLLLCLADDIHPIT